MPRPEVDHAGDTKLCPFCAETIKAAAIRCRYCRSDLESEPGGEGATETAEVPPSPVAPAPSPEPTIGEPTEDEPAPRSRVMLVALVVAAVLALVLAGLAVRDVLHRRDLEQGEAAARTVRATLPKQLETLLSYDYRRFDEGRKAASSLLTPQFRERYLPTIEAIEERATEQKRSQKAVVVAVAVVDQAPDEVTTLVFLNRTTSTSGSRRQRILQDRAVITSVREDGGWRIDDITFPTS